MLPLGSRGRAAGNLSGMEWNSVEILYGADVCSCRYAAPSQRKQKKVFVFIITRSNLPYPRKERLSSTTVSSASPEVCQHRALG